MTQDDEQQLLVNAVEAGEKAKRILIKEAAAAGIAVDFVELSQLDRDIKTCQDEIRRSQCRTS